MNPSVFVPDMGTFSDLWGFFRDQPAPRWVFLSVAAVAAVVFLLAFVMERGPVWMILGFASASLCLLLVVVAMWRHDRRSEVWRDPLKGGLGIAWSIAAAFAALLIAGMFFVSLGMAITGLHDVTQSVSVDYIVEVGPGATGLYEVYLPVFHHAESVQIVQGVGEVDLVDTEQGRALLIRANGPVTVVSSLEHPQHRHGASAYGPTLTADTTPAPPHDYHTHLIGDAPLGVHMELDVHYGCGTSQHRLTTTLHPGQETHAGTYHHPHGDLCGLHNMILIPFAIIGIPLMMMIPVFMLGVLVLTGVTIRVVLRGG